MVATGAHYLFQMPISYQWLLEQGSELASDRLLAWLSRELPAGKCPGVIEYHDALPMTATGKVARHLLA